MDALIGAMADPQTVGTMWRQAIERNDEGPTLLLMSGGADSSKVTDRAVSLGIIQLGTPGAGNHDLEAQVVLPERVVDRDIAAAWGIGGQDQMVMIVHCGLCRFWPQVASDSRRIASAADAAAQYHCASCLNVRPR